MESHFEKVAKTISNTKSNMDFKNRNTYQPTISERKLNQLKEKTNKQVDSVIKRNSWLEAQKRRNYTYEYDRLTGHIKNGLTHSPLTVKMLNDRLDELKKMAKLSLKGERHPIYTDTGITGSTTVSNAPSQNQSVTPPPPAPEPKAKAPPAPAPKAKTQTRSKSKPPAEPSPEPGFKRGPKTKKDK